MRSRTCRHSSASPSSGRTAGVAEDADQRSIDGAATLDERRARPLDGDWRDEFTYGADIALTEAGRLLGHVDLGLELLRERAAGVLDDEHLLAMSHCVLTHHGADRAPGRRFGSAEAVALHRLNALDASVKGVLEYGLAHH